MGEVQRTKFERLQAGMEVLARAGVRWDFYTAGSGDLTFVIGWDHGEMSSYKVHVLLSIPGWSKSTAYACAFVFDMSIEPKEIKGE